MSKPTVAIVGASTDRTKFSNKAVRAYHAQGWDVFPVNPKGGEIEGIAAYRSVSAIPTPVDRVTLYLPPALGVGVLTEIASAHPGEFFVNPGAESDELIEKAKTLGLRPILACSIVDIGAAPEAY